MHETDCTTCDVLERTAERSQLVTSQIATWARTPVKESSWCDLLLLFSNLCYTKLALAFCVVKDLTLHLTAIPWIKSSQIDQQSRLLAVAQLIQNERAQHQLELQRRRVFYDELLSAEISKTRRETESIVAEKLDRIWHNNIRAFTQKGFWYHFPQELEAARKSIIIFSPFISVERITALMPIFESAIQRQVCITLFTREPKTQEHCDSVGKLCSLGVRIIYVEHAHQKLAVIDNEILWEGSMNILSHFGNQAEHMRRIENGEIVRRTMRMHNLGL